MVCGLSLFQPALLYIVPAVIGFLASHCVWNGDIKPVCFLLVLGFSCCKRKLQHNRRFSQMLMEFFVAFQLLAFDESSKSTEEEVSKTHEE